MKEGAYMTLIDKYIQTKKCNKKIHWNMNTARKKRIYGENNLIATSSIVDVEKLF